MQSNSKKQLYLTSLSGAVAGSISKIVAHPIDTIKSKIQVNQNRIQSLKDYNKRIMIQIIKKTFKNEGIKGFYPGIGISAFGSAFAFSAYMTSYEFFKQHFKKFKIFSNLDSLNYFVSGLCAEACSCLLWLPIDVIKQRLQVQSQLKLYSYKNSIQAVKKIRATQGIQGLYRAYGATLMFFGPFSALIFMSYQNLKPIICKDPKNATLTQNIIATTLSSSFAGFMTNPLELSKLRMQIQRADRAFQKTKGVQVTMQQTLFGYKNMFHGIYLISKKEGFLALYRGAFLRILFVTPSTIISFSLTDFFRQALKRHNF